MTPRVNCAVLSKSESEVLACGELSDVLEFGDENGLFLWGGVRGVVEAPAAVFILKLTG